MAVAGIISQFASEASFLWFLRTKNFTEPHLSLPDLARLDERLEAHIDGLRVAAEAGWEICRENLESEHAEDIFAPAILAFESGDITRIQYVMDAVKDNQKKACVIISALGWLSPEQAEPHIEQLLAEKSAFHRYIGLAASAINRWDPGDHLKKAVSDVYPLLIARGLRAYGELGRGDELDNYSLNEFITDNDDGIRFSAAWSASLAGIAGAVETLKTFVTADSSYREKALITAMRQMKAVDALAWQQELAATPETNRLAVIGAGATGNAALIPWLIDQMKKPELARIAGEAFTMITGIDSEVEAMKGTRPEGFAAGPNDDPDCDNVAQDADENLPWPKPELIYVWWDKNKGAFQNGTRYLIGKPITENHLLHVLKSGLQRQRKAAALELAIMNPGQPLFGVQAQAFRQLKELESL